MTKTRRAPADQWGPAYAGPTLRLNYELVRPMLVHAADPTIAAVIVDYDAALERRARLAAERPPAASTVADEYRDEHLAAAREARPPTISYADVQSAEARERDHDETIAALDAAIAGHNARLVAAVRDAGPVLLPLLAHTRARMIEAGAPFDDAHQPSTPLDVIYRTTVWPALAPPYPCHLSASLTPVVWWPLPLTARAWDSHAGYRTEWHEWAWRMLNDKRGFRMLPDGRLQFAAVWQPTVGRIQRRAAVAAAGMANRNVEPFIVVDEADEAALRNRGFKPVTFG